MAAEAPKTVGTGPAFWQGLRRTRDGCWEEGRSPGAGPLQGGDGPSDATLNEPVHILLGELSI